MSPAESKRAKGHEAVRCTDRFKTGQTKTECDTLNALLRVVHILLMRVEGEDAAD